MSCCGDGVAVDLLALDDVEVARGEDVARRHALRERLRRGDDDRIGALAQVVEPLDARGDDVGGRRQILERRHLPARQVVDAARERRRVVGLAEEEAQVRRQPLRFLAVRRDHQRRARRRLQEPVEKERPRAALERPARARRGASACASPARASAGCESRFRRRCSHARSETRDPTNGYRPDKDSSTSLLRRLGACYIPAHGQGPPRSW